MFQALNSIQPDHRNAKRTHMKIIAAESIGTTFDTALDFVLKAGAPCTDNLENPCRGEVYMGISRVVNPEWPGWFVLDRGETRAVRSDGILEFDAATAMLGLVRSFYRESFWKAVFADTMPAPLAVVMFDSAVAHGRNRAFRFLQEAMNCLFDAGRLEVDGIFRRDSRRALETILKGHHWYLKVLVAEVLRVRQAYCDAISCGQREIMAVCRARRRALKCLVERRLRESVHSVACGESGLGLSC